MMRSLGDLLRRTSYLAFLIVAALRTFWRDGHPWREWRQDILRRLGLGLPSVPRSIWVHGEGMGEFNAAGPLLERLTQACPDHVLVLTTSRPQSLEWLTVRYPQAICLTLPWDLPGVAARVFRCLNPHLLVLLEFADGFCPGLAQRAQQTKVPVIVVNGRTLPTVQPRRYHVARSLGINSLIFPVVHRYCVQNTLTQAMLEAQGVDEERIHLTGNLKYDCHPTLIPALETERLRHPLEIDAGPVLMAACVHPEEERLVLEVFSALRRRHPDLTLILAPLNLGQVPAIEALFSQRGYPVVRRSRPQEGAPGVLIVDTYGELARFYALANVVILGGSLTPQGTGHSLIEPAAQGCAVVIGPYFSSQQEMVEQFSAAGAVMQAAPAHLVGLVDSLLRDAHRREQLGKRAQACVEEGIGATERTWAALQSLLPAPDRLPQQPSVLWKAALKWFSLTSVGQSLLQMRANRILSWADLYQYLGHPHTILCLGNGPSSEDPRLWDLEFDVVFRVNWRWRKRTFLPYADVVFTGDHRTLSHCFETTFGFRTIEEETLVLLQSLARRRWERIPCVTLERLQSFINEDNWPARPTNGAVMIASAAALQPQRLVIAGIDLFAHSEGSYPGEAASNRYAPMHARDVEIEILRRVLSEYRGELIVLSEPLQHALGLPGDSIRRAA